MQNQKEKKKEKNRNFVILLVVAFHIILSLKIYDVQNLFFFLTDGNEIDIQRTGRHLTSPTHRLKYGTKTFSWSLQLINIQL